MHVCDLNVHFQPFSEVLCSCYVETEFIMAYMQAMSPDGEAIVTGAGDETLRFWNVFSKMRSTKARILPISHFLSVRLP